MSWTTKERWAEVGQMITRGRSNTYPVAERYTDETRQAIQNAKEEARQRNSDSVTVTDLLAGLTAEENTRAQRVGCLKNNAFYVRWLTGLPQLPRPASYEGFSEPELGIDSKKALKFAVREADRDREYWIDSDHLLRGVMSFPNDADFALLKTEINLDDARRRSQLDREEFLPEQNPSLKVIEYLFRKHFALWVPPILSLACYLYILIQTFGVGLPHGMK